MSAFTRDTTGAEVVQQFGQCLLGNTVVITGASSKSLGAQTAIDLAKAKTPPHQIVLLGRSQSKVQPVIDRIASINSSIDATFVSVALDNLDSVRKAAQEVLTKLGDDGKIDILINNAGIMAVPYAKSDNGIEKQFAVNHVGHFLFTKLLFPAIKAAGSEARIVNLTSDGYQLGPFRPDDYNFSDGSIYHEWSGYGQSKTANILFTKGLASKGVTSFAVHPGAIMTTGLGDGLDMSLLENIDETSRKLTGKGFTVDDPKNIEQGVSTIIVAAIDPRISSRSGSYLNHCQIEDVEAYAKDPVMVRKLWDLSEQLIGGKFEI